MYVTAIVLAAGRGLRFRSKITKPLAEISSQPIIIYSLKTLDKHPEIKDIVVVANIFNREEIKSNLRKYRIRKIREVVLGGKTRRDSVRNGLKAAAGEANLVLIHDGVRPFINKEMVSEVIREAKISGAAIAGVPVKATIKKVKESLTCSGRQEKSKVKIVEKTLNRENLWEIQTPQVFRKALILKAYKKFGNLSVTDDSMLVEKLGAKVSVVLGPYNNIKITTPEDLILAEAIAKAWNTK